SLRRRPMGRVVEPLETMGARFLTRGGCRLPLAVSGTATPLPLTYRMPVASAQVKSAILLAGLNAPGATSIFEPQPAPDPSELMLRHFGAAIEVEVEPEGSRRITLTGQPELTGRLIRVPADPSSAAFPVVGALVRPGSEIRLEAVGVNPLRTGLYTTLAEMGA